MKPPDKIDAPVLELNGAARLGQRAVQQYLPRPCPVAPLAYGELAELLNGHVPVDFIAAIAGRRGSVLHLAGGD
jgi:hypothetical protein